MSTRELAPSGQATRSRSVLREAGIATFFLTLALVQTRPLYRDLRGQTLAGLDPTIDLWTVSWLTSHVLEPRAFFGGNVFYPSPHAVLFSDLSMGTVVLLLPLRPLLADPVLLYNAGVLLALAFGGWAFSRLVRTIRGDGDLFAGLLAGVVAAFSSHQTRHLYHLNLLTIGWLALLLLGLHRLASRPRWTDAVLVGVSFALCAPSSGYYGVAAAMLALAFGLFHLRSLANRRAVRLLILAAAVAVVSSLPYLVAFLHQQEAEDMRRTARMSEVMAFHPAADLTSGGYLDRSLLGDGGEQLFPGFVATALAIVGILRRRPHALFYAAAAAILLVVSLGPHLAGGQHSIPLPYDWLFGLPCLDAMRHPYTFAAVASMMLAVLAGLALPAAAARPLWLAPLLLGIVVAETLAPPIAVRAVPEGVPPVYRRLQELPPGPALEIPVLFGDSMLWAARHHLDVVNGNGAFAPRLHGALDRRIRNNWLKGEPTTIDDSPPMRLLDRVGLRYLLLPGVRDAAMERLAKALSSSTSFRLATVASDGGLIFERSTAASSSHAAARAPVAATGGPSAGSARP